MLQVHKRIKRDKNVWSIIIIRIPVDYIDLVVQHNTDICSTRDCNLIIIDMLSNTTVL